MSPECAAGPGCRGLVRTRHKATFAITSHNRRNDIVLPAKPAIRLPGNACVFIFFFFFVSPIFSSPAVDSVQLGELIFVLARDPQPRGTPGLMALHMLIAFCQGGGGGGSVHAVRESALRGCGG